MFISSQVQIRVWELTPINIIIIIISIRIITHSEEHDPY